MDFSILLYFILDENNNSAEDVNKSNGNHNNNEIKVMIKVLRISMCIHLSTLPL